MKQSEVGYHFVREKVVLNEITVRYLNTVDQIANIFTKGLISACFKLIKSKLRVRDQAY